MSRFGLEGGGYLEFGAGWKPLTACFVGVACGAYPVPFYVLPIVMGPIHVQSGWDFTLISMGYSIFGIVAALLAPVFGALCDRIGVRPVALWSMTAFGLTFGSFYFLSNSVSGYCALWALLGVVSIGSTPLIFSRAVNMWFVRNRGLALAVMLLGSSAAALAVPQVAQTVLSATSRWQAVFPAAALLPLLIAVPVGLLWLRDPRPEEYPAGVADTRGRLIGITLVQALRGYRFWVLVFAVLAISLADIGAQINVVQIAELHGLSARASASVITLTAFGILFSRLLTGILMDHLWAPAIACPAMLVTALACWMLLGTAGNAPSIMIAGFLLGFAVGAESDIIAYLAAKYFGMAHYGRIYGTLYLAFVIGASISPILYGMVRDRTGSYDSILIADIFMFAATGAVLLLLGRYPAAGGDSAGAGLTAAEAH
ncbi:MAG TPA: MFS transporter [Steroidobacteraceae bacterium]